MILSLVISFVIGMVVYGTTEEFLEARKVDYSISFNGESYINANDLENPILSYNDRTYISIRDMAKCFNADIYWYEKTQKISWIDKYNDPIINKVETALTIAKSIVEEQYSDRITSNTKYAVEQIMMDHRSPQNNMYFIYVIFNAEEELEKNEKYIKLDLDFLDEISDMRVLVNARSAEVTIQSLK